MSTTATDQCALANCRRRTWWLWCSVVALILAASGLAARTTTTVYAALTAATFTYDGQAIARVDAHVFEASGASSAKLSGSLDGSVRSPTGVPRVSTTFLSRNIATEAADEAAATAARPPGPYVRPSGATTAAQRASVQGLPCVDCGAVTPVQVADHIYPLVREWYETGGINQEFMRSLEAVQPQCPACSASQGGQLSWWSRTMKELFGFG